MRSSPTREIERLKRVIASLEAKAEKFATRKLHSDRKKITALARKLGYKTAENLFASLYGDKAQSVAAARPATTGKRKRAKITDEDRKAIIADLKAGNIIAAQIAQKYGISLPSVNLIKKAAGLTKSRKGSKVLATRRSMKMKSTKPGKPHAPATPTA